MKIAPRFSSVCTHTAMKNNVNKLTNEGTGAAVRVVPVNDSLNCGDEQFKKQ